MTDVHRGWLQDSMDDVSREKVEKIDRELAILKARYRTVRGREGYDKAHPRAQAILLAAAKLREDRARVLRVAGMIKEAFGG